jgi:hypothetical protein
MAYQKYTELEVWKKARIFASHISKDINIISDEHLNLCLNEIETLGKLINGYIRYISSTTQTQKTNNEPPKQLK